MSDGNEITRLLPHRHPFLFVDRVLEFEPDRRLVALKNVTASEPQFAGHFPERAIMPGVLVCEAMAQAGGLLVHGTVNGDLSVDRPDMARLFLVLSGIDDARFRRPIVPGDQLRLDIELVRKRRPLWKMRGVATVDGQVAAEASFSMVEVEGPAGVRAGDRSSPGTRIHPTAIVEHGAEIDSDVEIGAYATIGCEVRIGRGTRIGSHSSIQGRTTLGADNRVFSFATVGCSPQDLKFRGEPGRLEIGDRNLVREYASLSIGTEGGGLVTRVGKDNLFMNYSHLGHDCTVEDNVHLVNGVAIAGHVFLGSHAIVSGLAAVAQFVRIGEGAFVGGGSMVVMDVPPFCMANGDRARLVGLNAVGLERRGLAAEQVAVLRRAYKILFQSKLLARDAVERIRSEFADSQHALALAEFVAGSERGVTRP